MTDTPHHPSAPGDRSASGAASTTTGLLHPAASRGSQPAAPASLVRLRLAIPDPAGDAAACAAIYKDYVDRSVITFEEEAPDVHEFTRRMGAVADRHCWIVATRPTSATVPASTSATRPAVPATTSTGQPEEVLGYAYYSKFRERPAYRWVVESSIYLPMDHIPQGVGTRLYRAILDLARLQGYWRCYGVVTLPNPASEAIHRRLGFTVAGVWPRAGYKHGQWLDVGIWDLGLVPDQAYQPWAADTKKGGPVPDLPPFPLSIDALDPSLVAGILAHHST